MSYRLTKEVIEAIGWAYADCFLTLDKGGDPRETDMGDVFEKATKDLLVIEKQKSQDTKGKF